MIVGMMDANYILQPILPFIRDSLLRQS
jgi:hypothetical protein